MNAWHPWLYAYKEKSTAKLQSWPFTNFPDLSILYWAIITISSYLYKEVKSQCKMICGYWIVGTNLGEHYLIVGQKPAVNVLTISSPLAQLWLPVSFFSYIIFHFCFLLHNIHLIYWIEFTTICQYLSFSFILKVWFTTQRRNCWWNRRIK